MKSKHDIPAFVIEKMDDIERICIETSVSKIGLFGSALREDFDLHKSDLDFVVEFHAPDAPGISDRYFALAEKLEMIFGRPVDLVTARSIKNPAFSASVASSLRPLYAA
jgi:predicted nucleotidyltransferase